MKNYDWFWRVEPGARFNYRIMFDVFRYMRDYGIAYGFSMSALCWLDLETLSPYLPSFIDDNLNLLHKDSRIAWLRGQGCGPGARERERSDAAAQTRSLLGTDGQQDDTAEDEDNCDGLWQHAAAFSAWLVDIGGSTLHPNSELGSLDFLRSPSHQALKDHFGNSPHAPIDEVPVHSISASMFLPEQSVWNWRRKSRFERATPTKPPNSDKTGVARFDWNGIDDNGLRPLHDHWDLIAADWARHEKDPKTNLGHTAIDERNFLMTAPNGRYIRPEECLSCQVAIAKSEA